MSLRVRILLLLGALILTALAGGLVTIWHTGATDALLTSLIDKNLASFEAAEGLEIALLRQKGYLTYFFLDGNPEWLAKLQQDNKNFREWLNKAHLSAATPVMTTILNKIDAKYRDYARGRDEVIQLYTAGRREEGAKLHWDLRHQFLEIYDLCDNYKLINQGIISQIRNDSRRRAKFINTLALVVMPGVVLLGLLLAYILVKQLLEPIRRLSLETGAGMAELSGKGDEVQALSRRVHDLIVNVDQAQTKLERSQEHLLQSEKMAMVGKLAAGVAHSIRNPLTSVKMRLFSLGRSLDFTPTQQEDFEVISEEIRHIDTIVANFLEYSRPPKLVMQNISPSDVVDMALQLLRHRLESYNVEVTVKRTRPLPEVWADPDQLKEVLVNLLTNACEAMGSGGSIIIKEGETFLQSVGQVVTIQVSDNGPGIPESIQEKILQPFFSTKEEGTGLGLSIAVRILSEHGGWLDLDSQEGRGATFTINLPYRKIKYGSHPDS
jgi:signal transduction histidine kinase|uniref:histidine kinase n=1 Tax=Desulfobacca acetoxidans TaxID=60893 RepID=A0A7V6A2B0_9BACT